MSPTTPFYRGPVFLVCLFAAHLAAPGQTADDERILVFVRSTAPYEQARDDLLRIAPDGVHIPQLSAEPDDADRQEAELRAAGVRYLFQYKDLSTREPKGLEHVYEVWDDWVAQGILSHPRPDTPPEAWTQRGPDGAILKAYHDTRYTMCPSNPVWRDFVHDQIVALARRHGDGVMCDNPRCRCCCEHCRARFDLWMRARYSDAELREVFGLDPDARPLPMSLPHADEDTQRVLLGACRRFWVDLMADFFALVKAAGEEVRGPGRFLVAPNSSGQKWFYTQTTRGVELVGWGDAVTTSYVEPGVVPGSANTSYYCGLTDTRYLRNQFDYLYGACRPPGSESLLLKAYTGHVSNPALASLTLAEGLALGGTFIIYPTHDPALKAPNITVAWALPMVDFIHANRSRLWAMRPAADVAILYSPNDMMCGFPEHLEQCLQTCHVLQRLHVPHRLLHLGLLERTLAEEPPRLLIIPHLRCLDDATLERLHSLLGAGVKQLVIGEVGTHTWEVRRRAQPPLGGAESGELRGGASSAHLNLTMTESLAEPVHLLYEALADLMGRSPSAVAPQTLPSLLVSTSRSADGRTHWLHLLDYGAPLGERGPQVAMPVLRDIPVILPLPEGGRPASATLIRPGAEPQPLEMQPGAEGVRVTVPEMSVYALVEVQVEPGVRPDAPLLAADEARSRRQRAGEAVRLTAAGETLELRPVAEAGDAPMAELPPGLRYASPWYVRVEQAGALVVDTWAFGKDGGRPVRLRLVDMAGAPVAAATGGRGTASQTDRVWSGATEVVLMAPHAGVYLLLADGGGNHYRIRPRCAQAAVECHAARPLHTGDNRPLGPLYFWVPNGCEAFTISALARQEGETCRLVVRDPFGRELVNEAGEMDERQNFRLQVPTTGRGRAWSFTIGPGDTGFQDDVIIMLEGVPPLVAESPGRLLVPVE